MRSIQLMMITEDPEIASYAEECGVGRIFVDREIKGKMDRQKNLKLHVAAHSYKNIFQVKRAVSSAEIMLRINPFNEATKEEVDRAVDLGVDVIMLPYFHRVDEVERFLKAVDGRVKTNLLMETGAAMARCEQILSLEGVDEVHLGLNDLKISLDLDFLFEPLAGGLVDWFCLMAKKHGISYGVGGVGKLGEDLIPAEIVLKEFLRLDCKRVILSRKFHQEAQNVDELRKSDFKENIEALRAFEKKDRQRSLKEMEKDRQNFQVGLDTLLKDLRTKI